uniref:Uncharacterized protein n=1 Tax=Thermogemmatispora argillosa TaxID=2045280 RepID=A0A455T1S3_9CHLR|nr:hypothetical protein KTA_06040 [Thermogemmatispora argillosa]
MLGSDRYHDSDELTLPPPPGLHSLLAKGSQDIHPELKRRLDFKLSDLIDELKEIGGSGNLINIHRERLRKLLRPFIKKQLQEIGTPISSHKDIDEAVESGLNYSSKALEEALKEEDLKYRILATEADQRLAAKAREDRQHHGSLSDSERRDLAVLAALEVRGLVPTSKISDELLTQLHADANWYEEVFDKGKEIIEWPPEESFRRQQSSSGD